MFADYIELLNKAAAIQGSRPPWAERILASHFPGMTPGDYSFRVKYLLDGEVAHERVITAPFR
jgi:hypothetical protein